ncbi:MAG: hypothetical protein AB7O37_14060 [Vicinamibacteria bacterium]
MSDRSAWLLRRAMLALAAFVSMSAVTRWAFTQAVTDYRWHGRAAAELASGEGLATPHFLFQALLVALHQLSPGRDWTQSALDLTVLCQVALALLIASQLEGSWPQAIDARAAVIVSGLALALLVAGPVNLASWGERNLYLGYLSPSTQHNPTATLLRPLALAVWARACLPLFAAGPRPARATLADATLSLLSVLAKPSQAIALLPALVPLTALRRVRRQAVQPRPLLIGFVLPLLAVLGWQYVVLVGGGAGVEWAPLRVVSLFPGTKLARLLLSLSFPLCVVVLRWSAVRRDGGLILAWLSFGVGVVWVHGFAESGERVTNANLLWTGQVTLFVLFVASVRLLVREPDASRWRTVPCWLAFGLHLAGGLALCLRPSWW